MVSAGSLATGSAAGGNVQLGSEEAGTRLESSGRTVWPFLFMGVEQSERQQALLGETHAVPVRYSPAYATQRGVPAATSEGAAGSEGDGEEEVDGDELAGEGDRAKTRDAAYLVLFVIGVGLLSTRAGTSPLLLPPPEHPPTQLIFLRLSESTKEL